MIKRNYFLEMFEANARIDQVIWLPGALAAGEDSPADSLGDFAHELPEGPDAPLYADLPQIKRFAESDDYPEPYELAEALLWPPENVPQGFLFQMATPVTSRHGADGSHTFSWGHYRTCWRYAESMDAATDIAIASASERVAHDRAKAGL